MSADVFSRALMKEAPRWRVHFTGETRRNLPRSGAPNLASHPRSATPFTSPLRSSVVLWGFVAFVLFLLGRPAAAHDVMTSYSVARVHAQAVDLEIKISSDAAWPVVQDTVAPGALFVREEFESVGKAQLLAFAKLLVEVHFNEQPLTASRVEVAVVDDNFVFRYQYPKSGDGRLAVREPYLPRMGPGYLSHVTVLGPNQQLLLAKALSGSDSAWSVDLSLSGKSDVDPSGRTGSSTPRPSGSSFPEFFRLGVEHILTGYDHLLFLAGLLLVCSRLRPTLAIITCFTLAHSLTLGLSALNLFDLPSRWVEPLIALSIVYVGVENLFLRDEPKGRWRLTFAFGLIHGFGFAGVLKTIGLGSGGASIVPPLFAFNLGVETGQLAVTAAFLPLIWLLRRWPAAALRVIPASSAAVAICGLYWLVQRTVL